MSTTIDDYATASCRLIGRKALEFVTKTKNLMHSQLYLSGRLAGNPEHGQTKKGKLFVKLVIETSLIRETRPGDVQTESGPAASSLYPKNPLGSGWSPQKMRLEMFWEAGFC